MTRRALTHNAFTLNAITFAGLFSILLASAPVHADIVQLLNGDRLSGTVLRLSPNTLTLQTTYAGTLSIARKEIASIQTDDAVPVLIDGEQAPRRVRLKGGVPGRVLLEQKVQTTRGAAADPQDQADPQADSVTATAVAPPLAWTEVALDQVAYIHPGPADSGIGVAYNGRVTLSAAQSRGNTSTGRQYGEFEFNARTKPYAYTIGFKGLQATDSDNLVASNWFTNGNYDRFIADVRFFYARASLENDRFRGIDLRSTLGVGYGLRIFDTDITRLSVRGGLDLVSFQPVNDDAERYSAFGWGIRLSHWLWQRRLEIFHEQDGFWNLEDTRQVTLRSGTGVRVPIAAGLSASARVNVSWEKRPEPGRRSTDSTLLLGLGYEW